MIVIPAVDIQNGQCAQLVQGKPETAKYYGNPVEVAKSWQEKGAKMLHVIDLNAALGTGDNIMIVHDIAEALDIPIQFGGGIRSLTYARIVLSAGIDKIILGSVAVKDPDMVKTLAKEFGKDRIIVAVDSLGGEVVIHGWTEKTGIKTAELVKKLKAHCFAFLVTDVDKEGLMEGIDLAEFKDLVATGAKICASGGITSQKDIKALEDEGVWGCVVGKALYEGKIKI